MPERNIWEFAHIFGYKIPCAMWCCTREVTWFTYNQNYSHTFHLCNFHKTIWPDATIGDREQL